MNASQASNAIQQLIKAIFSQYLIWMHARAGKLPYKAGGGEGVLSDAEIGRCTYGTISRSCPPLVIDPGTGHSKTLCMILPLLLQPKLLSIVVFPLCRLQILQIEEFTRWGLKAITINQDTPKDNQLYLVGQIPGLLSCLSVQNIL